MALAAASVFEVQTGGNDTNGGGFVTGASGTDYSLVAGKRTGADVTNISTTDAVANGTTTITSATGNFTSALIGNIIYLTGGTGSIVAVRRQVTAVASATSITIDTLIAASTGMTMNIGGALLSPSIATAAAVVAGNLVYLKSPATYLITSASTNTAGGCLSVTAGTYMIGYSTNRTVSNTDTRPVLQLSSVSTATIVVTNAAMLSVNVEFDGNSQTTSKFSSQANPGFINCLFRNFTSTNSYGFAVRCYGTGCSATIFGAPAFACEAYGNTATPFACAAFKCISYGNTGATTNGFSYSSTFTPVNCVAYGNGQHGFALSAGVTGTCVNCIAENNTGKGFNGGGGTNLFNCSGLNNSAGTIGSINNNIGFITTTVSVFTNPGSNDFTLNNLAGGGAVLRAAGYPATFAGSGSVDKIDIGALQHLDAGGMPFARMFTGF